MVPETSPLVKTSKRRIVYRRSGWAVHEFEVWSGELVCRVAALRMQDALLLWLGGPTPVLGELAFGLAFENNGVLATALLGDSGADAGDGAAGLARRMAAAMQRPVWVASAVALDRFTGPIVARGLVKEMKNNPEFFNGR